MGLLHRQIAAFGSLTKEVIMIPDLNTARRLLEEGWQRNPGPWKNHSLTAAHCAKTIAERLKMRGNNIDPEKDVNTYIGRHDISAKDEQRLVTLLQSFDYKMGCQVEEAVGISPL